MARIDYRSDNRSGCRIHNRVQGAVLVSIGLSNNNKQKKINIS
jgi:hypothetical protein